jgi:transcriptional regulator with XRE-family HTH domain
MQYNNIKELAQQKGITVRDIAFKIKMSEAGLYYAIRNNTLKVRDLEKIAGVLEVPVDVFFQSGKSDMKQFGQYNKKSTIIQNQDGNINYNTEKPTDDKVYSMDERYWMLLQNIVEEMTDIFVKIVERDPQILDYLKGQREIKKFINQLNSVITLSEQEFFYNEDFWKYFERPVVK